jgi:hypothetical protein
MAERRPSRSRGRPRESPRASRMHVIAVRVPEEMLQRLEAYRAQVQAAHPYLRLSRADIIRTLLDKGLSSEAE